jgi:hypothetical protein
VTNRRKAVIRGGLVRGAPVKRQRRKLIERCSGEWEFAPAVENLFRSMYDVIEPAFPGVCCPRIVSGTPWRLHEDNVPENQWLEKGSEMGAMVWSTMIDEVGPRSFDRWSAVV